MSFKFTAIISLFLSLLISQSLFAKTEVQASVSSNSVMVGDHLILTIEVNDSGSEYQLDTRVLESDFTVYRPSQSSNTQCVNFDCTDTTRWKVTLQAKRVGELIIPALEIGPVKTEAIKISVQKLSKQATQRADSLIFMENSLNRNSVYLGQAIILTSKLFVSERTSQLNLIEPSLTGATVTLNAEDKNSQSTRNGIRYKTITREFKIIPEQSGNFTINSPLLTGTMHSRAKTEAINIRGESLSITIKEKPRDYQGEWLISEDVNLIEEHPLAGKTFHVGEAITRTILLQIASIDKDKMPNVDLNYPPSLRFYPDQDQLNEGKGNGLTYAIRTINHAIIADNVGQLTLPEIKLAWWNSQTDQQEFAILAAQTLTILAAEKTDELVKITETLQSNSPEATTPSTIVVNNSALIYWQIASAILLLMFIFLLFYHLSYTHRQNNKIVEKKTVAPDQNYLKLKTVLSSNNAPKIYQALLTYAQNEWPEVKTLSQLTQHSALNEADKIKLQEELQALELSCSTQAPYNSQTLSALLTKLQKTKTDKVDQQIMQLNP